MGKKNDVQIEQRGTADIERHNLEGRINSLIAKLGASTSDIGDWKVIKCYEAILQDKPLPYDLDELMIAREDVRKQINELQAQLAAM